MKDTDQCDVPRGDDPCLRHDMGIEWFLHQGFWYQAGAGMPAEVKQAWIAEHLRRDREEKKRRYN